MHFSETRTFCNHHFVMMIKFAINCQFKTIFSVYPKFLKNYCFDLSLCIYFYSLQIIPLGHSECSIYFKFINKNRVLIAIHCYSQSGKNFALFLIFLHFSEENAFFLKDIIFVFITKNSLSTFIKSHI